MYIDTHAHLFLNDYSQKIDQKGVLSNCLLQNVKQIWLTGTDTLDNKQNLNFAKKHPQNIKCWVGFHPENYKQFNKDFINSILSNKNNLKLIAGIGEVGVDLNWNNKSTTKDQQLVFEEHIKLANKYSLPVCIHSRDAYSETIEVMQLYKNTKFVWHCYNLKLDQTNYLLSNFSNIYFGFNAIVTYKSGLYITNSIKAIPQQKILTETDCPFLSPRDTSFNGINKYPYNTPVGVTYVYKYLANVLNLSVKQLQNIVYSNTKTLLNNN